MIISTKNHKNQTNHPLSQELTTRYATAVRSALRDPFLWKLLFGTVAITFWGCHTNTPWPMEHFSTISLRDTLTFSADDLDLENEGDTMSNAAFFQALPPAMGKEVLDLVDAGEIRVFPRLKFAMDKRYDTWQVEIRYSWFVYESLWIYDNREKRFSDRITVAEWYGGEGGQVRTAAWLWRQRDTIQLIQRAWERNIRLEGDEVATHYQDFVTLWEFRDGKFETVPVQDSAYLMEQFPLERME